MKLLYCNECDDIFRLYDNVERTCKCGKCGGKYIDVINAVYWGESAVTLGFSNDSFTDSLKNRPIAGMGSRFEAFIIPIICATFKKIKRENI